MFITLTHRKTKIVKQQLYILTLILSANLSFGQTLNITDFRKAFNYYKPTEHKQLLSKGFKLLSDTISINQKIFKFNKSATGEIIELTFTENGEGGEFLSIIYFMPTQFAYKNFISKLTKYKFKYSKSNKRYQLPTSSYSGEYIYLIDLTKINGKKYYALKYDRYVEKALSGPRPEFRNDKIPLVGTKLK